MKKACLVMVVAVVSLLASVLALVGLDAGAVSTQSLAVIAHVKWRRVFVVG